MEALKAEIAAIIEQHVQGWVDEDTGTDFILGQEKAADEIVQAIARALPKLTVPPLSPG